MRRPECSEWRHADGATAAAALTGLAGPHHLASALRAGFQYYLEKPVDLDALLGVVANLATPNFAGIPD
jgi:CheY-like chemotaxis protein